MKRPRGPGTGTGTAFKMSETGKNETDVITQVLQLKEEGNECFKNEKVNSKREKGKFNSK